MENNVSVRRRGRSFRNNLRQFWISVFEKQSVKTRQVRACRCSLQKPERLGSQIYTFESVCVENICPSNKLIKKYCRTLINLSFRYAFRDPKFFIQIIQMN